MDLAALQELGLTRNEARLYFALVQGGSVPLQTLAKRQKLARSTVYSALESLEKKGLIRQELRKGSTYYLVHRIEALNDLIEADEERLRRQRLIVNDLTAELKDIFRAGPITAPKIDFYEGKRKVERFLFDNLSRWTESMLRTDRSTWGYQDHTFVEMFKPWLKEAWKVIHQEAGIPGRILSNRSDAESSLRGSIPRREVRVLSDEIKFQSSFWVLGDFVILIMTRRNPIYAVQIHDSLLAGNLRLVFRHLYEQSQPMS